MIRPLPLRQKNLHRTKYASENTCNSVLLMALTDGFQLSYLSLRFIQDTKNCVSIENVAQTKNMFTR